MRKFSWLLLLLVACNQQVQFTEAQPSRSKGVSSFFKTYSGRYSSDLLEITIKKNSFIIFDQEFEFVKTDPNENQVVVKFIGDSYIVNFKQGEFYSVFQFKFHENKLSVFMLTPDEITRKNIKQICEIEKRISNKLDIFLLSPDKTKFLELIAYDIFDVVSVLTKMDQ